MRARRAEADRRAGHALPRGPGADAARGAARGEARRHDRPQDRGADPEARAADRRTCRRRGCSTRCRSCCCPGHAVETLQSLRAHGLSHGLLPLLDVILEQPLGTRFIDVALARHRPRVREDSGVSPAFLFATLLWHEVLAHVERGEGARRASRCRRCSRRWTRCSTRRRSASRSRAASRRRSRRSGRCSRASSSAPASVRSGCSSTRAFAPPTTSSTLRCASGERGDSPALVDWWTRFQDARPASARRCCSRTRRRRSAPLARARPQAPREATPRRHRRRADAPT